MCQISYVDIFLTKVWFSGQEKLWNIFINIMGYEEKKVIETKAKVNMISCVLMCLLSLLISFA